MMNKMTAALRFRSFVSLAGICATQIVWSSECARKGLWGPRLLTAWQTLKEMQVMMAQDPEETASSSEDEEVVSQE